MTDRMTLQRFTDLAQAYGGVIERWPAADQAAARALAQTPDGAAILADALLLGIDARYHRRRRVLRGQNRTAEVAR